MSKIRLDRLLVNKGLAKSRQEAYAVILAGEVKVNGVKGVKPDLLVAEDANVEVESIPKYVSRGGIKLEKALAELGITVKGLTVLDAGVSTGGFTDCLLKAGAKKVIAVDVGYGQVAWSIRQHPQVELHERVNLRYLKPTDISELADLATLDLSFISLTKVIPAVLRCLKPNGRILALAKPQFEVGKKEIGRSGVVKDPALHRQVLLNLSKYFLSQNLAIIALVPSRLPGVKGNIEYWFYLAKEPALGYSMDKLEKEIERLTSW